MIGFKWGEAGKTAAGGVAVAVVMAILFALAIVLPALMTEKP